jgi:hypothetical protein
MPRVGPRFIRREQQRIRNAIDADTPGTAALIERNLARSILQRIAGVNMKCPQNDTVQKLREIAIVGLRSYALEIYTREDVGVAFRRRVNTEEPDE